MPQRSAAGIAKAQAELRSNPTGPGGGGGGGGGGGMGGTCFEGRNGGREEWREGGVVPGYTETSPFFNIYFTRFKISN